MNLLARMAAYLLHPIFAPLISMYLLFNLPIYVNYKYGSEYYNFIYIILSLNLVIVPLMIMLYLKQKKYISSLEMEDVRERGIPYFISCIFFGTTYFLLSEIQFYEFFLAVFLAASFTVFGLFLLAQMNQKTSAHMAGIGGICGMLISSGFYFQIDNTTLLTIFILLAGFLGFSRLYLKAHTPWQVLSGFCLGLGLQFTVFL